MFYCTRCKTEDKEAFHPCRQKLGAHRGFCRKCHNDCVRKHAPKYRAQHRERIKAYTREYNKTEAFARAQVKGRRSAKGRFGQGKHSAKRRGMVWELTLEQHAQLLSSGKCEYCKGALGPCGSGLDRKDNSRGYTLDNCVPCCGDCNTIKADVLDYEEMKLVAEVLRAVRELKKEMAG
jgi:hypothetical protein